MDIRDISVGTILYILAQVPGALLFMGNAYVAQGGGDGGVCCSGVQSSVDVIAVLHYGGFDYRSSIGRRL